MSPPVLLDVSCLCPEHTDAALEGIYKALGADPPGGDIWAEHPNPFIRRLVELFTQRGLERLAGVRDELESFASGAAHKPGPETSRPAGSMRRWSADELRLARLYLQTLAPERFTLDDWMLLVDYLVQRYLPEDDLRSEADWLATRATLMGRVQAAMVTVTAAEADRVLAALPGGAATGLNPGQKAALEFGRARCAEHVTAVSEKVRRRLRDLVVDHQEAVALGNRAEASESLQSKLLDEFGTLNRDWRRIAVTEATENANSGFIASQPPGGKVRRIERYNGACAFCRSIHDRVFSVVEPQKPKKDPETEVWVGKNNLGRSASPRRRDGGALVPREAHEMWQVTAGAIHPLCRGSWQPVTGVAADPEFEQWLESLRRGRK